MNEIRIDFTELTRLRTQMAAAPSVVQEELLAAVTEADLLLEREFHEAYGNPPHKASGHTAGTMTHVERVNGLHVEGFAGSSSPHIVPVELGTRPHWPNVEALREWVRTKLGITNEKQARGVAFLIGRKISVSGTQGKHIFDATLARVEPQLEHMFAAAQARIASRIGVA